MKVKDLLDVLSKHDDDTEVVLLEGDFTQSPTPYDISDAVVNIDSGWISFRTFIKYNGTRFVENQPVVIIQLDCLTEALNKLSDIERAIK